MEAQQRINLKSYHFSENSECHAITIDYSSNMFEIQLNCNEYFYCRKYVIYVMPVVHSILNRVDIFYWSERDSRRNASAYLSVLFCVFILCSNLGVSLQCVWSDSARNLKNKYTIFFCIG